LGGVLAGANCIADPSPEVWLPGDIGGK
jgi:hypothetical protein